MTSNKKTFFIYLLTFLFVIVFSGAVEAASYQQFTNIPIQHPIRIDDGVDPTISAFITVRDPDNLVIISYTPMSFNTATNEHNFTLRAGFVEKLGTYQYVITANSSAGLNKTASFDFLVTPSGEGENGLVGFYFLAIVLSYGVLGLGLYKEDITISMLGTFALIFIGIYMLFFGIDIYKNYLTNGFAIITLGVAFYVSAKAAQEYLF